MKTVFYTLLLLAVAMPYAHSGVAETSDVDPKRLISSIEDGKQIMVAYKNYNTDSGMTFFFKRNNDDIHCMAIADGNKLASVFVLTAEDIAGLEKLFAWYQASGSSRGDAKVDNRELIAVEANNWTYRHLRNRDGIEMQHSILPLGVLYDRVMHKTHEIEASDY